MTDAVTLLINKDGVDLNEKNLVCLYRHGDDLTTFFFAVCLSVSLS
jgi:hypothetical protein